MVMEHSHATAVGHLLGHLLGTVLSLLVIQILLLSIRQDSLVSIVTRWWNWGSVPSRCKQFSCHCVCTSSWTHLTSSMMLTECCFTHGVKLTIHLLLVPRLRMYRTIPPLPRSTLFRTDVTSVYFYC